MKFPTCMLVAASALLLVETASADDDTTPYFDEDPSFRVVALPRYQDNEDKFGRGAMDPDELPPSRWTVEPASETGPRIRTISGMTVEADGPSFKQYYIGPYGATRTRTFMKVRVHLPDGTTREGVGSVVCMLTEGQPPSNRCQQWHDALVVLGAGLGGAASTAIVGMAIGGGVGGAAGPSSAVVLTAVFTPEGLAILALAGFAIAAGGAAGAHFAEDWVQGGCQMPPQWLQVHDYQYSWPRDFDFTFPGGWQAPHYLDPWLAGVGDGHGSGGDVLRTPLPGEPVLPDTGTPKVDEPPAWDFGDIGTPYAPPPEPGHGGDVS